MTKTQQQAVERFRRFLQNNIATSVEKYGAAITEFEVSEHNFGLAIRAQTEYTALAEGNLLRALSHEYWHVFVGRCGGMTVVGCPKSFEQFYGHRAFNMRFRDMTK